MKSGLDPLSYSCIEVLWHSNLLGFCRTRSIYITMLFLDRFIPLSGYLYKFNSLRKHAYSNILKILPPKNNEIFQIKDTDIFHISAQNIDCGYSLEPPRRDGSNEYPQSTF